MNILVPISPSRTINRTIEEAVGRIIEQASGAGNIHLVYTETPGKSADQSERVTPMLDSARERARQIAPADTEVITAYLAREVYLATPHDHAAVLATYASDHDIDLVVLDPNYSVDATDRALHPLQYAFSRAQLAYEVAAAEPTRMPTSVEIVRFVAVFALTFSFYLVVGGTLQHFDMATGIMGAIVAGILFRNVTFETTPGLRTVVGTFIRGALFVPYLLVKIIIANIQISYIILHPAMPIDPHLDRIETGLSNGLTVTALANSITLTPGTLTVDAERDELLIHSITEPTRTEVLTGDRTSGIQFVYYGLEGREQPGKIDLDRLETVAGPTDVEELLGGDKND